MYQKIKIPILITILVTTLLSSIKINPQIGIHSKPSNNISTIFSIPIEINYKFNNSIQIKHLNRVYNINHPSKNHMFYSDSRSDITAITEISFIEYINKYNRIKIGRDYIKIDKELFFSKYSSSFDHFKVNISNDKFIYNYFLVRLNNEIIKCSNSDFDCIDAWGHLEHYINRWYYYRDITFKLNKKISIYLSESIISTGENRTIEWYYLSPFGLFIAEQNHNNQRKDGDIKMNNDNSFIGMGIDYKINSNLTLKSSIIIDDFQIDKEDRPRYQDVYGVNSSIIYIKNNINFSIEFSYSSPWLYLNDGLFSNYQHNAFPIGLRSPNLYLIELSYNQKFNKSSIHFTSIFGEKGNQNLNTKWNPEYNKIDYFNFTQTIPVELYLEYKLIKKLHLPNIIFTHNWMGKKGNSLFLEWEYFKK